MVFNCESTILNTLKSVDGKVDEIHCYDGRWIFMPFNSNYSTDNTKSLIENFGQKSKSKIEYHQLPASISEGKSRTLSIENVLEEDWIFVIDSDEVVVNWKEDVRPILEQSKERAYLFFEDNSVYSVCRLFRKITGMKYFEDKICAPDFGVYSVENIPSTVGIVIHHNYKGRNSNYRASNFSRKPHP